MKKHPIPVLRRWAPAFLAGIIALSSSVTRSGPLSLPAVTDSAMGYGKHVTGAVSDNLYYTLGGGSVMSQPGTRSDMQKLGVSLGWSSDLMCGNFDLKTTVGNQLNGVTEGFRNLMGEVIQGATGAVASLPAMLIQRANPGLYDMLTNGVLQASLGFDKAQLNCQAMSKRLADFSASSHWIQSAVTNEYKAMVNRGDPDAMRVDNAARKVDGHTGHPWVGGQPRGGQGQPAIRPTHDLAAAGYNMMTGQPVLNTASVSRADCHGAVCERFTSPEEAAKMVVQVLGDRALRTCSDATKCTSGDEDQQPGMAVAGTGFAPMLETATKANIAQLVKLVNGTEKPTAEHLGKLKAGSLGVTAGVIMALRRDPDNAALAARLAGELAMADTVETALLMRQMLATGLSEPNVTALEAAVAEGDRRLAALDREMTALKTEMIFKRELARNSVLTIIARDNHRAESHPQIQHDDNTDLRFNRLTLPPAE
jgi:integrating conjugative element protein (TIGR03755 family)